MAAETMALATRDMPGLTSISTAIVTPAELESLRLQAASIYQSELLRCKNQQTAQADTMAKLLAAHELRLPPVLTASNNMHVINGRLTLSAKVQLALALRSGLVRYEVVERTPDRCEILFTRTDNGSSYRSVITMADATRRGLNMAGSSQKDNWKNAPEHMLFARAATDGLNIIAPDVTCGLAAPEDFGYTDDDAHEAPREDQDAPLGQEWASAFLDRCKVLPNNAALLEGLKALKVRLLGSPDYKLHAVPHRYRTEFEAWLSEREAESEQRIGTRQAQQLRDRVKAVAERIGEDPKALYQRCNEVAVAHGAEGWADLTATQAQEIVDILTAAVAPKPAPVADEEPAIEGEVLPDDYSPEPAPGATGRLRPSAPRPDDTGTHAHASDGAEPVLPLAAQQ